MSALFGFNWQAQYTLNGVGAVSGKIDTPVKLVTLPGVIYRPGELVKIAAGQSVVLWTYTDTQRGAANLVEWSQAMVQVDPDGFLYVAGLVSQKNSTTKLPTNLATNGRWQNFGVSCYSPFIFNSMAALWTTTATNQVAQSSTLPAIFSDGSAEEGRIYSIAVKNPGAADVTAKFWLWG